MAVHGIDGQPIDPTEVAGLAEASRRRNIDAQIEDRRERDFAGPRSGPSPGVIGIVVALLTLAVATYALAVRTVGTPLTLN